MLKCFIATSSFGRINSYPIKIIEKNGIDIIRNNSGKKYLIQIL